MDFMNLEVANLLLSPESQASLAEKLIIVAVVWFTMGQKVSSKLDGVRAETQKNIKAATEMFKSHLTKVEAKFDEVVTEMKNVHQVLNKDLEANSKRLARLEELWNDMNRRVERLEKP